jgi:hypothetical protein
MVHTQDIQQVLNDYNLAHQNAILDTEIILSMFQDNSNANNHKIVESLINIRKNLINKHFETGRQITPSVLHENEEYVQRFFIANDEIISHLTHDLVYDNMGHFQKLDKETQMRYKFFALGIDPYFSRYKMLEAQQEHFAITNLCLLNQRNDS